MSLYQNVLVFFFDMWIINFIRVLKYRLDFGYRYIL